MTSTTGTTGTTSTTSVATIATGTLTKKQREPQVPLGLSTKEASFCVLYAQLGQPTEAAIAAGYPPSNAARHASRLLAKAAVRTYWKELVSAPQQMGRLGLQRLAFSPVHDALRLLSLDTLPPPKELATMDLFCIAEIKRNKEGTLELKLHDRFAALQALVALEAGTQPEADSTLDAGASVFYQALLRSALPLGEPAGDTHEA